MRERVLRMDNAQQRGRGLRVSELRVHVKEGGREPWPRGGGATTGEQKLATWRAPKRGI